MRKVIKYAVYEQSLYRAYVPQLHWLRFKSFEAPAVAIKLSIGFEYQNFLSGQIRFVPLSQNDKAAGETTVQTPIRAGTFKALRIRVSTNNLDAAMTFVLRVNGVSSALTISIGAGVTGVLTVETDVAVSKDDLVCLMGNTAVATFGVAFISWSLDFDAT